MKSWFIVLSLFSTLNSSAQLLNGSFEVWDTSETTGIFGPVDWGTWNPSGNQVVRSDNAFSGQYAVQINGGGNGWTCDGIVAQTMQLDGALAVDSFTFRLKYDVRPLPSVLYFPKVAFKMYASCRSGNQLLGSNSWTTADSTLEYTSMELTTYGCAGADRIKIGVQAGGLPGATDFCGSPSVAWIDDVEISELPLTTASFVPNHSSLRIFPNPSQGEINVDVPPDVFTYQIIHASGKIIQRGELRSLRLFLEERGVYFLHLRNRSSKVSSIHKLVIH